MSKSKDLRSNHLPIEKVIADTDEIDHDLNDSEESISFDGYEKNHQKNHHYNNNPILVNRGQIQIDPSKNIKTSRIV
eukprot:CAMPEP_0196767440 /NCGR_PEP_ID=MMETSP1095-20130614/41214_1 /TAXON_ID=96789 ORGANISM="Chromulina nebulosa, Strain UTEXLB2642" /NCGR_SAMPLE_ID=MMETSP1095 /ASSEMBLY_ACC=CAM_ASM_000446 /LENGTH=76 /DNA_ID=CAMNT_0042135687 /DNA_START=111 /DNA_END=338 /DNA_ORIENTATION=+